MTAHLDADDLRRWEKFKANGGRFEFHPNKPDAPAGCKPVDVAALVSERGKTHGRFEDSATCAQDLKDTLSDHLRRRGRPLTATQLEALHMILSKIGRIVAGDPNFDGHWDDIAGYADLANKPGR